MTDAKYFANTKKGEIFELKSELNSDKKEKRREAVKKVIASIDPSKPGQPQHVDANIKLEIFNAIQKDMVPANIALEVRSPRFLMKIILSNP